MNENINKTTTKENEEERLIYLKKVAIINKYMRKNYPIIFKNITIYSNSINDFMCELAMCVILGMAIGLYSILFSVKVPPYVFIIAMILPFIFEILTIKEHCEVKRIVKELETTKIGSFNLIGIQNFLKTVSSTYGTYIDDGGLCEQAYYDSSYKRMGGFDMEKLKATHNDINAIFDAIVDKVLLFELDNFEEINKVELASFISFREKPVDISYKLIEISKYYARKEFFEDVNEHNSDLSYSTLIRIPNDSYDYIIENELNGEELINYVKSVKF